ncbi:exonuclease subunit SbcD [bacterium]|nr:exonuclease subunit SbcD [bacterium]
MKFIHTADWHLGNSMHSIDRIEEVRACFKWLKMQIEEQKAEALIVSGDIFDTINPPVEARHEYYKFLASLLGTCCMNVIVIAGNHDSASFINAPKELLEALNIHVIGNIADTPVENCVFELKDSENNTCAVCAAIPFVREAELRKFAEDGENFADNSFKELYKQAYNAADSLRAGRNIPIIATGHLYAANLEGRLAEVPCGEKTDDGTKTIDLVGNLGAVNVSVFPPGFDYVALGHIHYPTRVAKNDRIRYSGSPFLLGFDEVNIRRNLLLVDVQRGCTPQVTQLEVPSFFDFMRIEGTVEEIKTAMASLCLRNFERNTYIEIAYDVETGKNIHDALAELDINPPLHIVSWKPRFRSGRHYDSTLESFGVSDVTELSEEDVFKTLILSRTGLDPESVEAKQCLDEYLPLFKEIANEAEQ